MIILVPYFGELERFRPLLDRWFDAYRTAGVPGKLDETVVLLSDLDLTAVATEKGCGACQVDISGFKDLCRPGQPFDVKGALVCAYLLGWEYPTLVLDLDALLERDPTPTLSSFRSCPIAMPIDDGALTHDREATLSAPFQGVKKLCAGVIWFPHSEQRSRLVAGYRRAFEELVALPRLPWSPPLQHLVEQHAWSIVAARRGGGVLPRSMNWAPHFLGENPSAIVNHHYGWAKWSD